MGRSLALTSLLLGILTACAASPTTTPGRIGDGQGAPARTAGMAGGSAGPAASAPPVGSSHVEASAPATTERMTDALCQADKDCRVWGHCHAAPDGRGCRATTSQDCLGSERCKQEGQCTTSGEECLASTEAECRASAGCAESGQCHHHSTYCLAETDQDCLGSLRCKTEGDCHRAASVGCEPRDRQDCLRSEACKKEGKCQWERKVCPPGVPVCGYSEERATCTAPKR